MNPIKYETALLRETGYNYHPESDLFYNEEANLRNCPFNQRDFIIRKEYKYPAPFQEEVIEWLWNEHKIHIELEIHTRNDNTCYLEVLIITFKDGDGGLGFYSTKEYSLSSRYEAIEEGIVEALKLIKNK